MWCSRVYAHMYLHRCMCVREEEVVCVCVHACMYACVLLCVCVCVCVCVWIRVCASLQYFIISCTFSTHFMLKFRLLEHCPCTQYIFWSGRFSPDRDFVLLYIIIIVNVLLPVLRACDNENINYSCCQVTINTPPDSPLYLLHTCAVISKSSGRAG